MTPALEALGLSKRYGRGTWALRDCCLAVPQGRVVALVGPNGAGKTTLMHLAVGLLWPTSGNVQVLGWSPRTNQLLVPSRIGFLAQDRPLYSGFTVEKLLGFGRHLNPRWDDKLAHRWLQDLGVPLDRKVSKLSGGQQAQVALSLAVAKRPDLLLLDEPLANLDPLARREFVRSLLETVTEQGLTVIYSSHIVADLERFCDYLILLSAGRVQVAARWTGCSLITATRGSWARTVFTSGPAIQPNPSTGPAATAWTSASHSMGTGASAPPCRHPDHRALSASQPLLDLPGNRGGHLRRPGGRPSRAHRLENPTGELTRAHGLVDQGMVLFTSPVRDHLRDHSRALGTHY